MSDKSNGSSYKDLAAEVESLRAQVAQKDAEIASLKADLAASAKASADLRATLARYAERPVGVEAYVLKTRLTHNDVRYEAGAEVPFDPKSPPPGCDGLIEGVHYEQARVVVRNVAAN